MRTWFDILMDDYLVPIAIIFWIGAFVAAIWTGRIGYIPFKE